MALVRKIGGEGKEKEVADRRVTHTSPQVELSPYAVPGLRNCRGKSLRTYLHLCKRKRLKAPPEFPNFEK